MEEVLWLYMIQIFRDLKLGNEIFTPTLKMEGQFLSQNTWSMWTSSKA